MQNFEILLKGSSEAHGHLCPGQVLGVRMAILGCHLIGLDEPNSPSQIKKIIVYVEIDRCAADAISYVTGVRLGRRSLKFMDYGIMAATFVNLETEMAFRVISTEESRDLASVYAPAIPEKAKQQLEAYKIMPENVLFRVQEVKVDLTEFDLPGPTIAKVSCSSCGEVLRDRREVIVDGKAFCRHCTHDSYIKDAKEIDLSNVNLDPRSYNFRS